MKDRIRCPDRQPGPYFRSREKASALSLDSYSATIGYSSGYYSLYSVPLVLRDFFVLLLFSIPSRMHLTQEQEEKEVSIDLSRYRLKVD